MNILIFKKASEPPAIPPPKSKPRSNSFSHPEESRKEDIRTNSKSSIIIEEDEDIEGTEIGNGEMSKRFIPNSRRISKSRSLSVQDERKSSMLQNNIRALTVAADSNYSHDGSIDMHKATNISPENEYVVNSDNVFSRNIEVMPCGQRLSFQGTEFYQNQNKGFAQSVKVSTRDSGKNH